MTPTVEHRPLKVGIDARLFDGRHGGIQHAVMGLAHGLSRTREGGERYLFLCYAGHERWLAPHIAGPCSLLPVPPPRQPRFLRALAAARVSQALFNATGHWLAPMLKRLPVSGGTVERAGLHLMHFAFQSAFKTGVPSIYQPWDLQHLHLPEFFPKWQRLRRDFRYRFFCRESRLVVVSFRWMKDELIKHYGLPEEKVAVIPMAAPIDATPDPSGRQLSEARQKFVLPSPFLLYPAQTYPHKNHLGLLEALGRLRATHGLDPTLVCTGAQTPFFGRIATRCRELGLERQVRFLGYVSPLELKCLFLLCRGLVFPSLYEGWGLPVTEALSLGLPIACSNLTVLQEQAQAAALYFDPGNADEMLEAIRRLWTMDALRQELAFRARRVSSAHSLEKNARMFRAQYRRLGRRPLSGEDVGLLSECR